MSDAVNALQKAIYDTLTDDATLAAAIGAGGIFDHRTTGKPMPYIVFAESETRDFGPDAEEHLLTIEAWSDAAGRKQVQSLADQVKALLHDAPLTPSGAVLVNLQHRSTRMRREPKTFVAEMVFRAVTE